MKGYLTSYVGLFEARPDGEPSVSSIEIPLFQRDYAQGRAETVKDIPNRFPRRDPQRHRRRAPGSGLRVRRVDRALQAPRWPAATHHSVPVALVSRLAARPTPPRHGAVLLRHTPSARMFCESLDVNRPHRMGSGVSVDNGPALVPVPVAHDQTIHRCSWCSMPSTRATLWMSMHQPAWTRLTARRPAVWFYLLPLDENGRRGPLHQDELAREAPHRVRELQGALRAALQPPNGLRIAHKLDGPWADVLWPFHGDDQIVDDEFLRYIGYITELCELREGRVVSGRLGPRARAVFGEGNARAGDHLDFLFGAFDKWQDAEHISKTLQ